MIKIRKPHDPSEPKKLVTSGVSRTKQSFKDETDINHIMARYRANGVVDHFNKHQGQYGDFYRYEYQDVLNFTIEVRDMFMTLPAEIRKRFDHDPQQFLEFTFDPDNEAEMAELGLIKPIVDRQSQPEPPGLSVAEPGNGAPGNEDEAPAEPE